jgi:hypothetical protein
MPKNAAMGTFSVRLHRVSKDDARYALDSMEEIFNEYDCVPGFIYLQPLPASLSANLKASALPTCAIDARSQLRGSPTRNVATLPSTCIFGVGVRLLRINEICLPQGGEGDRVRRNGKSYEKVRAR